MACDNVSEDGAEIERKVSIRSWSYDILSIGWALTNFGFPRRLSVHSENLAASVRHDWFVQCKLDLLTTSG